MGDDVRAEPGMRVGGLTEHGEFAQRLVAVFDEGRRQRSWIAQFTRELRDPRIFVQCQIRRAGHRGVKQFRNGTLVHGGVLPHVEAGQMKAETIRRPTQQPQPAACNHARIIRDQRAVENIEVGLELPGVGVRSGLADRLPHGFDVELQRGRRQPGVDARHRQPVGLAASMRRSIGRAPGEHLQFPGNIRKMRGERQFGAQRMQLFQIKPQHAAALHLERAAHHLGGHERVAVAIAADPASHTQERRQFFTRPVSALVQPVLKRAMQPWHLVQEGIVVKRKTVGDLIEHGELGTTQNIGLPQRHYRAAQLLVVRLDFLWSELDAFAPVEQRGYLHLAIHGALAPNFGWMGGQDRTDQRAGEKIAQIGGAEVRRPRMGQGLGQRT